MTKEDVSEDVKGDSVLGWSSSHQRPVIHQVASAPMPSDCGECPHIHTIYMSLVISENRHNEDIYPYKAILLLPETNY